MLGQAGAVAKRPPHSGTDNDYPFRVYRTAYSSTSVGPVGVLGSDTIPFAGCWVTFVATSDCFIHFETNSGTSANSANSTNSWPMIAGVEYNWWINDTSDFFFRVIRSTADGALYRYRSNL